MIEDFNHVIYLFIPIKFLIPNLFSQSTNYYFFFIPIESLPAVFILFSLVRARFTN